MSYENGTRLDRVVIPGVTFIPTSPFNVFINKGTLQINAGVDRVDLIIRLDSPATHAIIETYGLELCQTGRDAIDWMRGATLVEHVDTFQPMEWRCSARSFEHTFMFDELKFDVPNGQMLRITRAAFDIAEVPGAGVLPLFGIGLAALRCRRSSRSASMVAG